MAQFDYSDEFLEHLAELFKSFAHLTRLKILRELHQAEESGRGELSVNEIQERIGTSQANISKHLSKMEDEAIVEAESEGTSRQFRIASKEVTMICDYVCGYMVSRLKDQASLLDYRETRETDE